MQCKKCGFMMPDNERFCSNCGSPLMDMNSQNYMPNNQANYMPNMNNNYVNNGMPYQNNGMNGQPYPMNGNYNPNMPNNYQQGIQPNNGKPKKKSALPIVLAIIGAIVLGILIFVLLFVIHGAKTKKMICESPEGSITIMFNKDGLTGYTANGILYEFDEQKEIASKVGVDDYLKEFNDWFTSNTTGTCTIDGKELEEKPNNNPNNNNNNSEAPVNSETKIVGDDTNGYLAIPKEWVNFVDVDGASATQYSDVSATFILSVDIVRADITAKEYAQIVMAESQKESGVGEVKGATVTIGKNKQYTAYQVYMSYPAQGKYLVTYWFEAEDGKVHYIGIEGPVVASDGRKLTDYLKIVDSFSLTKQQ